MAMGQADGGVEGVYSGMPASHLAEITGANSPRFRLLISFLGVLRVDTPVGQRARSAVRRWRTKARRAISLVKTGTWRAARVPRSPADAEQPSDTLARQREERHFPCSFGGLEPRVSSNGQR